MSSIYKSLFLLVVFVYINKPVNADFVPKNWTVNLDLPPSQRWPWEDMVPYYNETVHKALQLISVFVPGWLEPEVEEAALLALPYLGDYAQEIESCSKAFSIPLGDAVLLNLIYEVEAGCTSITTENSDKEMLHARNLDFPLASVLRDLVIQVQFTKSDKVLYRGTTFVGYVGLLTGMRPGSYSITCDERDSGYIFENLLEALLVPGTSAAALLVRDTLEHVPEYSNALNVLSTTSLAAPIYFIVNGAKEGEGSVITRDRMWAADVWNIDVAAGRWYLVETNYDHWKPAGDNRRKTAQDKMNSFGYNNMSLSSLLDVLSTNPVLNDMTIYTTLISSAKDIYYTIVRSE
eukprot:TRINITY_DN3496_c0_g3_i1.p1 TRINITY_DN3496_c0_g3~~TRINITY_DN3496_c0_g3_i1.p1  ORF type:complete len:364 (-),score=46.86 TRINITY_DN3496_c0_g3_i1:59-1102(-)